MTSCKKNFGGKRKIIPGREWMNLHYDEKSDLQAKPF